MSYTPTQWIDGETPVNAKNLNNLEQGVSDAVNKSASPNWNAAEGESGHVLNRTHWVDVHRTEVLTETQINVPSSQYDSALSFVSPLEVKQGDILSVIVNGTEYKCAAQLWQNNIYVLGDGGYFGFGNNNTGEPFCVLYKAGGNSEVYIKEDCTISITHHNEIVHKLDPKFLPDGVPYVVDGGWVYVLPETSLAFTEGQAIAYPTGEMSLGETYTIKYNGTEYECTTVLGEGYMFGNLATLAPEFPNTGEPFVGAYAPAGVMGDTAVIMIMDFTGATESTVSICKKQKIYHKLDAKCLPDGIPTNILVVLFEGITANYTGAEIYEQCVKGGKVAFMVYQEHTLTLNSVTPEGRAKFSNFYYDEGRDEYVSAYAVVEADGSVSDTGFRTFSR